VETLCFDHSSQAYSSSDPLEIVLERFELLDYGSEIKLGAQNDLLLNWQSKLSCAKNIKKHQKCFEIKHRQQKKFIENFYEKNFKISQRRFFEKVLLF